MGVVIELSLSFVDAIFLAENNNCGPFLPRFDNHVPTLSKFAKGNPFFGRKVVGAVLKSVDQAGSHWSGQSGFNLTIFLAVPHPKF